MGGGGYVAGPGGLAALRLGLPLVLTEADRHLGLANRLLARRARRVCLAFEIPGREGDRYVVTGRPVPAAILAADRDAARERFGIEADRPCLLVFGGSQGARSINLAALDAFAGPEGAGAPPPAAITTCSTSPGTATTRTAAGAARCRRAACRTTRCSSTSRGSPTRSRPATWSSPAPGGSIFELAAAGRPGDPRPLSARGRRPPATNAEWMRDAGAAVVIDDAELDGRRWPRPPAALLGDPGDASARWRRPRPRSPSRTPRSGSHRRSSPSRR